MTDVQHIDLDSDEWENTPKALRDQVKKLQAANKQLVSDLGQTRTQLNSRLLGDVLKDKGYKNPKRVEKDLLAEGIDPLDSGAVEGWLAEFGDDYAKGAPTPPSNPVNDERAQQRQVIDTVVQDAQTPNAGAMERAMAEIDAIERPTGDQVLAIYRKHGV